jgi:phage tail sheath gpL-like
MWRRFVTINKTSPLYAIAVSEGVAAVKANQTISFGGTATSSGSVKVWVGDEFVEVGFIFGDTAATVAAAVDAAIAAKTHWAVTSSVAVADVTLEAKQGGTRGNQIRVYGLVSPATAGISATPSVSTQLSGGTVDDDITDALAAIVPDRYYYILLAQNDSTNLGLASAQILSQAQPIVGIRQRLVFGHENDLASLVIKTTAINSPRAEAVWQLDSDYQSSELASHNGAIYALFEQPLPVRCNYSGFGQDNETQPYWTIKAPRSGSKPTRSQLVSALNSGITPIAVNAQGAYLVKRVTTKFLTAASPDYRIRDAHKVTVSDRYADDLISKAALQLRGKQIADDPAANEPEPNPQTVTPQIVKPLIDRLTLDYAELGLLQRSSEILAGTKVLRETSPATRISATIPLQTIDILDQVAFEVNQIA